MKSAGPVALGSGSPYRLKKLKYCASALTRTDSSSSPRATPFSLAENLSLETEMGLVHRLVCAFSLLTH